MRARSFVAVSVATLAVAGCAASTQESAGSMRSVETTAPSAVQKQSEQDAGGDLSAFSCTPSTTDADLWTATGTLTNPGDDAADYRITVVVVGAGNPRAGAEHTVEIDPGESADIEMRRVRGPDDGTCQVQVLRTP